jgi:4-amino-4-deoxy-L-arabinose transferase-like glycosyltransferase
MKRPRQSTVGPGPIDAGPPLSPLPSPGYSRKVRHALLAALVALYLCIGSIHAYRTPTGATGYQDAPDEDAHVTYARVVARGRLPSLREPGPTPADTHPSYEWHQPPAYYLLVACVASYGYKAMRIVSLLLGAGCIIITYRAARLLLPAQPETAVVAAGITAFLPGHCAITSVVNNDPLLEVCFSLFLLQFIVVLVRGLSLSRAIIIGLILGVGLLTKVTAVLLVPVAILGLAVVAKGENLRAGAVRCAAAISGAAALVSGWWFARNFALYHEWLPLNAFRQAFARTAMATDIVSGRSGLHVDGWTGYWWLVVTWTFHSFVAVYSTEQGAQIGMPAYLPTQIYLLAFLAAVVAVVGLIRLAIESRARFTREQRSAILLLLATLSLVAVSFVLFTAKYFQAQGRYFYPAMLPISILGAMGWRTAFPQRYMNVASALLLAMMLLSCAAFLRTTS